MTKRILTIATRESPLAVWQANWVKFRLEQLHPFLTIRLLGITTRADKMLETPLYKAGGKGLFVKELEEALFEGKADIAVHSMKDMPMDFPPGLSVPVMCEREDPRDVFVSNSTTPFTELPPETRIGTSSLRRKSQLYVLNSRIMLQDLRGNINTRLAKLDDNQYAGLVLAAAGLKRLGLEERIQSYFSTEEMLPAPGQGVLGIECRKNDEAVLSLVAPLNHFASAICVMAERAMCKRLGGGCHAPIGAFAEISGRTLHLRGLVGKPDGSLILRAEASSTVENAKLLGYVVAEDLINQGAEDIVNCNPKSI